MTLSPNVIRVLSLISGVLAVVLGMVNQFGLPTSVRTIVVGVGGAILVVLAYLEHPTTVAKAKALAAKN